MTFMLKISSRKNETILTNYVVAKYIDRTTFDE